MKKEKGGALIVSAQNETKIENVLNCESFNVMPTICETDDVKDPQETKDDGTQTAGVCPIVEISPEVALAAETAKIDDAAARLAKIEKIISNFETQKNLIRKRQELMNIRTIFAENLERIINIYDFEGVQTEWDDKCPMFLFFETSETYIGREAKIRITNVGVIRFLIENAIQMIDQKLSEIDNKLMRL